MNAAELLPLPGRIRKAESFSVRVIGYRVSMYLGMHDFEKETPQDVLISVIVTLADRDAFWNYDYLVAFLEREIAGRQIETQEELGAEILAFVESGPPIVSVTIETRKPDIFEAAEFVGYCQTVEYE